MASLQQQTIKNSLYGFLSYLVPILFTIFLTPIIINSLGIDKYGLFILATTITGFFSLFTFGLAYGAGKVTSEYIGTQKTEGVGEVIGSTVVLLAGIGLIGLIIAIAIAIFGLDLLRIPVVNQSAARSVFLLAGCTYFFGVISSAFTSALAGAHRLDLYTKMYLAGQIFLNVAMIILVYAGFDVPALMTVQLAVNVALLIGFYLMLRHVLPGIVLHPRFSQHHFMPYVKMNLYVYLHDSASIFLFQLDKVLISIFSGPAAVSFYSIPGTIGQKIQGGVGSMTSIFFPVSSSLIASGDHVRLRDIYRKTTRLTGIIAFALLSAVIIFGSQILLHWVGPDFLRESLTPLYILAITYFLLALFTVLSHFLLGLGKVKQLAIFTTSMFLLNLILLLWLLPLYGVVGAAWAYLASLAPLPFMIYYSEKHFLGITDTATFYGWLMLKLCLTGIVMYLVGTFVFVPLIHSFFGVIVFGAVELGMFVSCYKIFGFFDEEDWLIIRKVFGNFKNYIL